MAAACEMEPSASPSPAQASPSVEKAEPSPPDQERAREILDACSWRDLDRLRALAESPGGFLSDSLRQQAWPVLLGVSRERGRDMVGPGVWKELPRHRDEDQVQLDVDRAFVYYPHHKTESELARQKDELSALIVEVLRTYPFLCYFQGYHDICQVLLLVLPAPLRVPAVARLSALRIRDFMLPSLTPAIAQLRLLPDILRAADPALWRHLGSTEPFFALSGTLTMYAHDVPSLPDICRLFDALLAREPVFSVYVFARIVLARRPELFATPADEPEMLHSILSKLPRPLDLDALVAAAARLLAAHPPESLPSWRAISAASALRTARRPDAAAAQTMADARTFFDRQVRELRWMERRDRLRDALRRYRRPARMLALAALVGVVAVLVRRSPGPLGYAYALLARWWA